MSFCLVHPKVKTKTASINVFFVCKIINLDFLFRYRTQHERSDSDYSAVRCLGWLLVRLSAEEKFPAASSADDEGHGGSAQRRIGAGKFAEGAGEGADGAGERHHREAEFGKTSDGRDVWDAHVLFGSRGFSIEARNRGE